MNKEHQRQLNQILGHHAKSKMNFAQGLRQSMTMALNTAKRDPTRPEAFAVFYDSLAVLLDAGIPLARAVDSIAETSEKQNEPAMAAAAELIGKELHSGLPLSSAMQSIQGFFSHFEMSVISQGEDTGRLSEALKVLADQCYQGTELRHKIKSALTYPLISLGICLVGVLTLPSFLFSAFQPILESFDIELPLVTKALFFLTSWEFFGLTVAFIAGLLFLISQLSSLDIQKRKVAQRFYWIPYLGPAIKKLRHLYMTTYLAQALKSQNDVGGNLLTAIDKSRSLFLNEDYREALSELEIRLEGGEGLGEAIAAIEFFPAIFSDYARAGQESGKLSEMLENFIVLSKNDIEHFIDTKIQLINPFAMILMGFSPCFVPLPSCSPCRK